MQTLIESFFAGLGIQIENLSIEDEGDDVSIRIETPDSSLLIGVHGKNMDAFKHLLSRMLEKKLGRFVHVHFEVNDYMKAKDDRLFHFLESKIAFIMSTGKSIRIPNLSAFERKKAHNFISEKNISGLSTKSEGEGGERALIVSYTGPLKTNASSSVQSRDVIHDLSEDGVGI